MLLQFTVLVYLKNDQISISGFISDECLGGKVSLIKGLILVSLFKARVHQNMFMMYAMMYAMIGSVSISFLHDEPNISAQ